MSRNFYFPSLEALTSKNFDFTWEKKCLSLIIVHKVKKCESYLICVGLKKISSIKIKLNAIETSFQNFIKSCKMTVFYSFCFHLSFQAFHVILNLIFIQYFYNYQICNTFLRWFLVWLICKLKGVSVTKNSSITMLRCFMIIFFANSIKKYCKKGNFRRIISRDKSNLALIASSVSMSRVLFSRGSRKIKKIFFLRLIFSFDIINIL